MILDLLSYLLNLIGQNAIDFTIAFGAIVAAVTIIGIIYTSRNDRRARDNLTIEQRRLTEVNIRIGASVQMTPVQTIPASPATATPPPGAQLSESPAEGQRTQQRAFMVLRLPLTNIGDGPVDMLGMLVSARVLSAAEKPGIGTRSRDVEWGDYQKLYWNEPDPRQIFLGISTTKHLVTGAKHYVRLAAKESTTMRRLDAVTNVPWLRAQRHITVMFKVFMVARGYPLGEILRQLGGGPPEPAVNVAPERLRFQTLAQPNYRRWQLVQEALINLNRFVFRLALYDLEEGEGPPSPQEPAGRTPIPDQAGKSPDPLGWLTEADHWRMFLLHHWEFIDESDAAPQPASKRFPLKPRTKVPKDHTIRAVTDYVKAHYYPDLGLPDSWNTPQQWETFKEAHRYCREHLDHLVRAWKGLTEQTTALLREDPDAKEAEEVAPDEAYPRLIRSCRDYQARWLALMREGYLVSRPFRPRRKLFKIVPLPFGRRRALTLEDMPEDPRVLEPYVMRAYYFLETVALSDDDLLVPTPKATDHASD